MNLTFLQCVYLLYDLITHNMLQRDPRDTNNVLVYRLAGDPPEENPEGWYTQNILECARELVDDQEGQKFLTDAVAEFDKRELTYLNPALLNI